MAGEKIGIKVADGSFFPIMDMDSRGGKKFVLTTNHDYQEGVQMDFFLGQEDSAPEELRYIGGMRMSKIEPEEQGKPEVAVYMRLGEDGSLVVRAVDEVIGEEESKSYDLPMDEYQGASEEAAEPAGPDESSEPSVWNDPRITDYAPSVVEGGPESTESPESTEFTESFEEEEPAPERKSRGNILLAIGFVLIGLFLMGMLSFLFFRQFEREPQPPLREEASQVRLEAGPGEALFQYA